MRYFVLLFVVILLGCSSQKPSKVGGKEKEVGLVELQIKSYFIYVHDIEISAEVVNNSSDTITILKGSPLKKSDYSPSKPIIPFFFSAEFKGKKAECMIVEPAVQGATFLQESRFFTKVPPGGKSEIKLRINDFESFYCDDLNFEIKVKYEFDKRLLDKLVFDEEIASLTKQPKQVTDNFYEKMVTCYPEKLEASITQKISKSDVYMEVLSLETISNMDYIEVEIHNNSESSIQLLQPRPIENGRDFTRKKVIPEFFSIQSSDHTPCDTIAYQLLDEIKFKTTFDFIEIAPGEDAIFTLVSSHYNTWNCSKENTIEIIYNYEKRFDNIEFFNSEIKAKSQFVDAFYERLHRALTESYKEPLKTTIYLK